jgi:hypothetical protein
MVPKPTRPVIVRLWVSPRIDLALGVLVLQKVEGVYCDLSATLWSTYPKSRRDRHEARPP